MTRSRLGTPARLVLSVLFATLLVNPLALNEPASGTQKSPFPSCIGSNLKGVFAYSNVYAGGDLITVAVVNVGVSACRLSGYPKLLGTRGGHEFPIANVVHGTQDVNLRPAILGPRVSGALILDAPLGCNANVAPPVTSDQYTGAVIVLPNDKGHVKVVGLPLYMPCGLGESSLGWAKGFVFN